MEGCISLLKKQTRDCTTSLRFTTSIFSDFWPLLIKNSLKMRLLLSGQFLCQT